MSRQFSHNPTIVTSVCLPHPVSKFCKTTQEFPSLIIQFQIARAGRVILRQHDVIKGTSLLLSNLLNVNRRGSDNSWRWIVSGIKYERVCSCSFCFIQRQQWRVSFFLPHVERFQAYCVAVGSLPWKRKSQIYISDG